MKHDERKISIISRIDDKILEKCTAMRLLLLKNIKLKKSRAWLPWTVGAACVALVASLLIVLLPQVGFPFGKQIPTYQGMTVSNEAPAVPNVSLYAFPSFLSLSSPGGANVLTLDHEHDNQAIKNKPENSGNGSAGSNAQDILTNGGEYFAQKNEDIYIYIHLSNPDNFEILSFTLNGVKYSSYMFEQGSDMETLILKYNVGDVEGTQAYTIDAIKYVDGEEIKDVRMEGNKTVLVHIYPANYFSMSITPTLTAEQAEKLDADEKLYIELYRGDVQMSRKQFVLGETVSLNCLEPNATYRYAVVGVRDGQKRNEKTTQIFYEESFTVEPVVLFEEVQVEGLTVTATVSGAEQLTSLGLYEGETLYRELPPNAQLTAQIPIGKSIQLVAAYTHNERDYKVSYVLPTIQESEGLLIVDGVITGIGTCADSNLYLNHPIGGDGAFRNTTILNVYMGDGVTSIGNSAFSGCKGLTSITIPNSVTSIGNSAFSGCTDLTSITIPDSVTSIGNSAFSGCTGLTSITIPDSVTSMGGNAFRGCQGLKTITIPDTVVTSIGGYAFDGCNSLISITLGDNVTSIDEYAFYGCPNLRSVTIGDGVTSIGMYTFKDCPNLTSVTLGDGVTSIDRWVFYCCSSLKTISIGSGLASFDPDAFSEGTRIESITVSADNPYYSSIAGNLYNKTQTTLIRYAPGKPNTDFAIPEGVESIAPGAFAYCTNLATLTIPGSIKHISHITVTSWYFEEGGVIPSSSLERIILREGVESIGDHAFTGCTNITVIIPRSVKSIGTAVTNYKPMTIQYVGSAAEWSAIDIDDHYMKSGRFPISYNYVP